MGNAKKKETRIMKVTMYADEFEKYDKGIIHSDSGLRNENGQLSTLPDIAPVTDEELPLREVVKRETIYVEKEHIGNGIGAAVGKIVVDILNDPEIQEGLAELGKAFWYYKVRPRIKSAVQWLKSDKKAEIKASRLAGRSQVSAPTSYEIEVVDEVRGKIVISGEDAEQLVGMVREEARRLSAMIYLLSNITVKDDKTQDEYMIEQAYIRQLVSNESRSTMKMLVANRNLLDEETAVCFSDFLSGYIRHADQRIAIPVCTAEDVAKTEK